MKKNEKKWLGLFSIVPMIAMPLVAISCVNWKKIEKDLKINDTYPIKIQDIDKVGTMFDQQITYSEFDKVAGTEKEVTKTLWEYFSFIEGEVLKVSDGDTLSIKVTKGNPNGKPKKDEVIKVRIPLIDTLEENTKDVKEREKNLAHLDSNYARSILPNGTKVRLISEDGWVNLSYDRHVGYLFFGENFQKNFSIDMLSNGWTLPRFNDSALKDFIGDFNKKDKKNIISYLLPFAAHAFNKGYLENKGFYNKNGVDIELEGKKVNIKINNPIELAKEYVSHGETLINTAYKIMYPSQIPKQYFDPQNNIYEFLRNNQNKK
ncbi:hypothetical protein OF364_01375 [Mycoplasma enhydrae]|uniref:hypothetical protein n=1 Tax=Mycoplasma enhydrae TaxID=2499220 RepID=UPI0021E93966|nr:hypothetical protein [Mycoplasma enhydrae]MCV3753465.1 hypothetical protein [Mycoplasma enhydrae]